MRDRLTFPAITLAAAVICLLLLTSSGCGGKAVPMAKAVPEGALIAFRRNNQIWTARDDGRRQRQLTSGYDASPAVSPDGKTIIFQHSEGEPIPAYPENLEDPIQPGPAIGIYAVPSSGGSPKLVTPSSWLTGSGWTPLFPSGKSTKWVRRDCMEPSFSPDGSSICFTVADTIYDRDTTYPNPSPESLLYSRGIAIMNANGTGEPRIIFRHRLSESDCIGGMKNPRFSNDGEEIYVVYAAAVDACEIDKIPVAGGDLTRITPATNWYTSPEKPNGVSDNSKNIEYRSFGVNPVKEQLALVENRGIGDMNFRITRMDLDDQSRRRVYVPNRKYATNPAITELEPLSFAPSGANVAFTGKSYRGYKYDPKKPVEIKPDVYVVPTTGGEPTKIITNGDQPCFGRQTEE